jgi:hypothetical protein
MLNVVAKNKSLDTVYKQHLIADQKLRQTKIHDVKQFDRACIAYLKSTEVLLSTMDATLNIQRRTPLYFIPVLIKSTNRVVKVGLMLVLLAATLLVTMAVAG